VSTATDPTLDVATNGHAGNGHATGDSQWCRVTAHMPCRHCGRSNHRCSVHRDGRYEICYSVETGSIKSKVTKDGATYYVRLYWK
jgi:hypothetical protein